MNAFAWHCDNCCRNAFKSGLARLLLGNGNSRAREHDHGGHAQHGDTLATCQFPHPICSKLHFSTRVLATARFGYTNGNLARLARLT